ncbi:major facilitator superfamily domain-containing protein [Naematelia encephala]|uniref:Major facilitator superfamily domain-containing protein n=1 Tax=Naematelia encephala TaxID=71784 RepID=A0A1Y2AIZ0_9TREE|nr:major facilitator superfamily domain-containing protein [Naematelia encephala]
MAELTADSSKVVRSVFFALILDLLAFTLPLPLFPRLIAWYLHREAHSPTTLLARLLNLSHTWRASLQSISSPSYRTSVGDETKSLWTAGREGGDAKNWDIVLLGGAMGSLFSLCQCVISPWLGGLSDRYGRKKVLLATMVGNLVSAAIWVQSTSFSSFLLSRLVGGLSEGNVQLSTAIIGDVTTPATRSKSLALIGIAFSICFTLGPSIGAYFASRPLPITSANDDKLNVYALPATISLILLAIETIYLAVRLPETKNLKSQAKSDDKVANIAKEPVSVRKARLDAIGRFHGLFLLFFSGAEFTLTFLTYDLFAATNSQNGRLLSYIGILSALLQARHVRPSLARKGELRVASYGIITCCIGLGMLAILPFSSIKSSQFLSTAVLYIAATGLSYTSATVVTGLTAAAAACCDEEVPGTESLLRRGKAMGQFRSKGQLGRAVGPLLASSIYWLQGPTICYSMCMAFMMGVYVYIQQQVRQEKVRKSTSQ